MSDARIAQAKPCLIAVEEGKRYFWCTCGRSEKQPFCDGSHRDTDFLPLVWTADKTEEKLFCACKQTRAQPFCDGSHNRLSDTYAEASADDGANAVLVEYETDANGAMKATLDNGCYVVRIPVNAMRSEGTLRIAPAITDDDGSDMLSQYSAVAFTGTTPSVSFADADVVLFVLTGSGEVSIGDRSFAIEPESGVCVKPGEAFRIVNERDEPIELSITVCPQTGAAIFATTMPAFFDESVPNRVQRVDVEQRETMGDRFYQVLVDHELHRTPITQFIGEIPKSRAAHHHHLYEETITVLSGEGFMWTDNTKTAVQPGDVIYLPLKQAHSLECTTDGGMRLVGLFYPSMSPAINY